MKEIDEFLQFLLDHHEDDRIEISKKMKYGHRYYYINFDIDSDPNENNNPNQSFMSRQGSVDITIDNRNKCLEISENGNYDTMVFENEELVNKWSNILEEYVNKQNDIQIKGILEKTLSVCYNKNLYREYQMKKILPDDESL
jgi:hypothetical protein